MCWYALRKQLLIKYVVLTGFVQQNSEFDYHMNDDLGRMVLNPDVNVRSRGVMEKCSMCIQMTQATILNAKKEGRELLMENSNRLFKCLFNWSNEFGDVNDKEAEITSR
jgi:molybdopterin-containing oxidoreductase family iron-sulfur binding subunit